MENVVKAIARIKHILKYESNIIDEVHPDDEGGVIIQLSNGMNFHLASGEVEYRADEYDSESISPLDFYSRMVNESDYHPRLIEFYCNNFMTDGKNYDTNLNEFLDWVKLDNMKLSIDNESVHIYLDHGEDIEQTSILYWQLDEVEVDNSVSLSIANAINLFHTNKEKLLDEGCSIKILNSY